MSGVGQAMQATFQKIAPGIYHIQDPMGVCMTLLCGRTRALLWDTGYGLFNLPALISRLTDKPLTVCNSHGHHDHCCANHLFPEVWISRQDIPVCEQYTGAAQREAILRQAAQKRISLHALSDDAYRHAGPGVLRSFPAAEIDLGGTTVRFIPVPGHTPGSMAALVLPQRILLTGDSWNPTTWLFFAEALPVAQYANAMRALAALPFDTVLAPHFHKAVDATRLRLYIHGLQPSIFTGARPVTIPGHEAISTYACHPEPDSLLVFDAKKASLL